MKRILLFLPLLFLPLLFLLGCSPSPEKAAIERQLLDYPESRVQDIYKSFCQDNLGPEHLIPNPEYARDYLRTELATFRQDLDSARYDAPSLLYYAVGDEGNYVRVDLSVVLDSLISEEKFLDAFIRSANEGKRVSKEQWISKWGHIAGVIRKDFMTIPEAEQDLQSLDSLVKAGSLIMHHSRSFGAAYHPHFRIIARDIFESELRPLIDR